MTSIITSLGGGLNVLIPYVQKGFDYIAEAGKIIVPYGVDLAKIFADPDKGFFISLAGYYSLSLIKLSAEDVANSIESLAQSIESWDPLAGYENWVRSVTGLGDRPIYELFNPMVAWEDVNSIDALKEASCGFGDLGCYINNALKWLAKAILTPVFFIKNILLAVGYFIIAGLTILARFLAVGFLRYIIKPLAYAVIWAIDSIRNMLKTAFCYYMKIAQVATFAKEIVKSKTTLGKAILRGILKSVSFYIIASLVAKECVLVSTESTPIITPPTPGSITPPSPITSFTGNARIYLYAYETVSYAVPSGTGRATISLNATESVNVSVTPRLSGSATISLNAVESISIGGTESVTVPTAPVIASDNVTVITAFSGSATISLNATENVNVTVLGKVTGSATVSLNATENANVTVQPVGGEAVQIPTAPVIASDNVLAITTFSGSATVSLNATENINVTVQQASSEQVPVPTSPTIASDNVTVITAFSGSATISLNATENVTASLASSGLAQASAIVASANISTTVS